mmetsp:Transcript_117845/g.334122  ORF Transcript_117845/g.334122 Transcript_117845/m.334122 type:complete len:219 (-) Transcript_117845:1225-1881(-)
MRLARSSHILLEDVGRSLGTPKSAKSLKNTCASSSSTKSSALPSEGTGATENRNVKQVTRLKVPFRRNCSNGMRNTPLLVSWTGTSAASSRSVKVALGALASSATDRGGNECGAGGCVACTRMCVSSQLIDFLKLNGTLIRISPSHWDGPTKNGDLASWFNPGTSSSRRSSRSASSVLRSSMFSMSSMLVKSRVNSTETRPVGVWWTTAEPSNPASQS